MSTSEKLPPQILVIEPDEIERITLYNVIERSGFDVIRLNSHETNANLESSTINAIAVNVPNVVIINSAISHKVEVNDLTRILRQKAAVLHRMDLPIIFILNQGASIEDYKDPDDNLSEILYHPYTSDEVILSIKSLLRRSAPVFKNRILRYKDLTMNLATYKVYRGDKLIRLGPTEFKILQLLLELPKVILSRERIINYVWGKDNKIEPRTVDVHVNRLRSVIKNNKYEPALIKTVRAAGYCLNLPGEVD